MKLLLIILQLLFLTKLHAMELYEFDNNNELNNFSILNPAGVYIENGDLIFERTEQSEYDHTGISTLKNYLGDLEVVLEFADLSLFKVNHYQSRLNLRLVNGAKHVSLDQQIHSSIDHTWLTQSDYQSNTEGISFPKRRIAGKLRLVRKDNKVSAWVLDQNNEWLQVNANKPDAFVLEDAAHVNVHINAYYNPTYRNKISSLSIYHDQDGDGLLNDEEILIGTNPAVADYEKLQVSLSALFSNTNLNVSLHKTTNNKLLIIVKNDTKNEQALSAKLPGLADKIIPEYSRRVYQLDYDMPPLIMQNAFEQIIRPLKDGSWSVDLTNKAVDLEKTDINWQLSSVEGDSLAASVNNNNLTLTPQGDECGLNTVNLLSVDAVANVTTTELPVLLTGDSGPELLANGNMEQADDDSLNIPGWNDYRWQGDIQVSHTDVAAFEGNRSALIQGYGSAKAAIFQHLTLKAGTYRLTAKVASVDLKAGLWQLTSSLHIAFDKQDNLSFKLLEGDSDWRQLEAVFNVAEDMKATLYFFNYGPGSFLIDDVSLKTVEACSEPKLENTLSENTLKPLNFNPPVSFEDILLHGYCDDSSQGELCQRLQNVDINSLKPQHANTAKIIRDDSVVLSAGKYMDIDAPVDWRGYDWLRIKVQNPSTEPEKFYVEIRDDKTQGYWSRVNWYTYAAPGISTIHVPLQIFVGEKSVIKERRRLDLEYITRLVLSASDSNTDLTIEQVRLEPEPAYTNDFPKLIKLDAGSLSSPVFHEFTPLYSSTTYREKRGYGFSADAEIKRVEDRRHPENLLRDWISLNSGGLNFDLPNGEYHVWMMLEDPGYWEYYPNYSKRAVIAEGKTVLNEQLTVNDFWNKYYRHANDEDLPGDDIWQRYISARYVPIEFDITVSDGQLNIRFEGNDNPYAIALSALVIYPTAEANKGTAFLAELWQQLKQQFNYEYKQVLAATPQHEKPEGELLIFHRSPSLDVDANYYPSQDELVNELSIQLAQGEYEPLTVSLYPNEDLQLTNVELNLPGLEVKANQVRYKLSRQTMDGSVSWNAPRLLDPLQTPLNLPKNIARRLWFTVHAPENTSATSINGNLKLSFANGQTHELPITVKVLPYKLPAADVPIGYLGLAPSYPGSSFSEVAAKQEAEMIKSIQLLHSYGMTGISGGIGGPKFQAYENGQVTMDFTQANKVMSALQGYYSGEINTYGGMGLQGFSDYSNTEILSKILAAIKDHGLSLLHVVGDEPSGEAIQKSLNMARAFKDSRTAIFTSLTDPQNDERAAFAGVIDRIYLTHHNEAGIQHILQQGSECATYNLRNRYHRGVYQYKLSKLGCKGHMQFMWSSVHVDPWYDLDGRESEQSDVFTHSDGTLRHALELERYREAVDDYRYLLKLEQTIANATDSEVKTAAQTWLQAILDAIEIGHDKPHAWTEDGLDEIRNTAILHINNFQQQTLDTDGDGIPDNLDTDPNDASIYPGKDKPETLLSIYYGNQGWAMDEINRLETWQGQKNAVVLLYTNWNPNQTYNLFKYQLPNIWKNGNVPLITWQPSNPTHATSPKNIEQQIAQGNYDTYIISWAKELKSFVAGIDGIYGNEDDRRAYISMGHEMNGNWYPWSANSEDESPAHYIGMWHRVRDNFNSIGFDNKHLQWIWTVNNADIGNHTAEDYYPGDDYVDWIGINGYNWGINESDSRWRSPAQVFDNMLSRMRILANKPISINETGVATDGTDNSISLKNQWIKQIFIYARENGIRLLSWFNEDKQSGNKFYDWQIFEGANGIESLNDNKLAYPGYRQAVKFTGFIYADVTNPQIISDKAFTGKEEIDITELLQTVAPIPATPLQTTRPIADQNVQYDRIEPNVQSTDSYDYKLCDVSQFWAADRVSVGGRASGNNEDVCKVQVQLDDGALKFVTKWPINNIYYPLTPNPAWAQFRFSVPEKHTASTVEYELAWYKLFGSEPSNCHPDEIEAGKCQLDVSDDWQANVSAGLYLLWAQPGDSTYQITGPHDPIEKIGYSGKDTFKAVVPDAYRNADEVIVTLVAYNQYTKACEKDNPSRCTTHENENLEIHAVSLKTEKEFNPPKQPAQEHPRLLGDNAAWQAYWKPFADLACSSSDKDGDWGAVFNIKNIWEKNTLGYASCKEDKPASLQNVADAAFYLNPSSELKWNRDRALRILFLLRNQPNLNDLKTAFINYELNRFDSVTWNWGYKCFDLGTEPEMKFWSIFVDVFWNDLSATDKAKIDAKLSDLIDCYLQQVEDKDWSIFNGNNWTPVLNKAAMYWAITYYHEDARASKVVKEVLNTLWLHRDFYLEDGAYKEGIVEYTNVSYSNLREINNLVMQAFGQPLESVAWERIAKTSRWYLDFMAPDGQMADFGDSWAKRGLSTLDPLHMLLWQEMIGQESIGNVKIDPCIVREYFSNKWFFKGTDDPWSMQPSLARNWQALADQCQPEDQTSTNISLFEKVQSGALRTYLPGSTEIAKQNGLRFKQADQTWLAVSAVPNDFPHRELDFGGLIWSAYGNRLLYDFGYGEISKAAQKRPYLIKDGDLQLFDNLALGANTLVVEDATQSGYNQGNYNNDTINTSQIYAERGKIEQTTFGDYKALHLDALNVYGANNSELGWLRYFDRWLIALADGNYLVIDAFAVKDDRGTANVQEYWHTEAETDNSESCNYSNGSVALSLENAQSLLLKPRCSSLERNAESPVVARIAAASLQAGEFSIDSEIITYRNRNGSESLHKRARYKPINPVNEDVRVFILQAAPNQLKDLNIKKCTENTSCFDLSIDGKTQRLNFNRVNNRYVLQSITDQKNDDTTKLAFETGYPKIENITQTTADLKLKTNENGKVYYVVLADGATAPTDVKADANKVTIDLTADTETSSTITGLSSETAYDIYLIIEDAIGNITQAARYPIDLLTTQPPSEPTPVNVAPTISGNPPTIAKLGYSYTFIPTASDDNGDNLTFSITNKPDWATFDTSTGRLSGTPNATGNYTGIEISVSDGQLSAQLAAFDIQVVQSDDTTAPTFETGYPKIENITQTTADLKVKTNENGKAYYVVLADGATVPTDVKTHINKITIDLTADTETSSTITGLSSETAYDIYLIVEDAAGNITKAATSQFTTEAAPDTTSPTPVNVAPTISGNPATIAKLGYNYTFTPTATDENGDNLTFSITNKPDWATFDTSTGRFSGIPNAIGNYTGIEISVSDDQLSAQLAAFDIEVQIVNIAELQLSHTKLKFGVVQGDNNSIKQKIKLSSSDSKTINWSATVNANWLRVEPSQGTTTSNVLIDINTNQLPNVGKHTATISFINNETAKTIDVPITLDVVAANSEEVKLTALEVVQVIQDLNNSIPLIAEKPTFVRAHVSSTTGKRIKNVNAKLTGKNGDTVIFEISPSNVGASINVSDNPNRSKLNDSFLFELPKEFSTGNLTLEFAGVDKPFACADTGNDCQETVNFETIPAIDMKLIDIIWLRKLIAPTQKMRQAVPDNIYNIYPISKLNVTQSNTPLILNSKTSLKLLRTTIRSLFLMKYFDGPAAEKQYYYGVGGKLYGTVGISLIPGTLAAGAYLKGIDLRNFANNLSCVQKVNSISSVPTGPNAIYGFNAKTKRIYPPTTSDFMTKRTNSWISDYNYKCAIETLKVRTRSTRSSLRSSIINTSDNTVTINGRITGSNTGVIDNLVNGVATTTADAPTAGDYKMSLQTSDGTELAAYSFGPININVGGDDDASEASSESAYSLVLPHPDNMKRIVLYDKNGTKLDERIASANAPIVTVTAPNGGETIKNEGKLTINWDANDADGDTLTYAIYYSLDGGSNWQTLVSGYDQKSIEIDVALLAGTTKAKFRVTADDSFNSGSDESDAVFTVEGKDPEVSITSPNNGDLFISGQTINFVGQANDKEDGKITGTWSSDRDGDLTTTSKLAEDLAEGTHTITLTATDSQNQIGTSTISINVYRERPTSLPATFSISENNFTIGGYENGGTASADLTISNGGDGDLTWSAASDANWLTLSETSGTAPSDIKLIANPAELAVDVYSGNVILTSDVPGVIAKTIEVTFRVQEALPITSTPVQQVDNIIDGGTIEKDKTITGATLRGNIINEGMLKDINFEGEELKGGTLAGKIANKGIIIDVKLSDNTEIQGGRLRGNIVGAANASLDNLEIVDNSQVNNVTLGKNVTFGTDVTLKDVKIMGASLSNITLEGTIRTVSSATIIKNVVLGAKTKVIGGKLAGTIKGDSSDRALLQHLKIEPNSQLTEVIIADGVDIEAGVTLGTGVQFSKVENIPFNIDLTETLPKNSITVDLSADPVVDGKGLLVGINDLPSFIANKIDQSSNNGHLKLKVEDLSFEVIPVKVKRVDSKDQNVRLGFGNTVYFKTDDGIEVEAHPAVQDLTTLKTLLAAIELPKLTISKEGNIQVPINDKLWISGRAELASKLAEEAEIIGFKFKEDLVVLVFEKDGQKREQVLYPAPASALNEEASLTEEGILFFRTYKGRLDYSVENGEAIESLTVSEIADSNGDGLKDFLISYPEGYTQKLFALSAAEE